MKIRLYIAAAICLVNVLVLVYWLINLENITYTKAIGFIILVILFVVLGADFIAYVPEDEPKPTAARHPRTT